MARLGTGLAIFALCFALCHCKVNVIQSLDGTWVGRETDYWYEFPTTVPGGVYSDLMDLEIIDDVFFGFNDNVTSWVGTINWTYALNFTIDPTLLEYENVNLVFDGVDTFADIVLNNVTVGSTTNMFVRYVFDVKDILKAEGNNTIVLKFINAPEVGLKRNEEQLKKYRIPWECPPDAYRGVCHINMIRKMQASFAWDWGVALPSMGIWKPVYIEAFDETVIRHLVPRVSKSEDESKYLITINTYFAPNQRNTVSGTLNAKIYLDNNEEVWNDFDIFEKSSGDEDIVSSVTLSIDAALVQLWWPNGYGEQPLYELAVSFTDGENGATISKKVNIGFRFVELVEESLEKGQTFYFKVNGVPIFVKGSNEIPINILPELGQDRQTIRYLLQSAKEVNMNMLRVWGGGVYESDYFYEIADQLGIMIWQDFMFACSLYPANELFLADVVAEVDHNIKRLYHHPSIVVYSGNNENEGVLSDNWYSTADNYDQYKADYVALYIETVRAQFERISGGEGVFISSSPSNAKLTENEGWVGQSPSNQYWGDVHFYNYVLDSWNSNSYPIPRFCSEYGYQSFPLEDSWMTATNITADLKLTSEFMDWRQHHPLGNEEIALLISENLQLPDSESEHFSSAFFYLSQIYSAQAIRVETEHYRRYRSYLTEEGNGYTMGALYWQLNDVWVAPTWSSIDYTGRWKMLHYFAKSFFANVIVTGHKNLEEQILLYTVNDQLSPIEDVSVLVQIFNYDSPEFRPVHEYRLATSLEAGSSQLIETIETEDVLQEVGCELTTCFFYFVVQKNASLTYSTAISPENYVFPAKLKNSELSSPDVEIVSVSQTGTKTYEITVRSDNIALFVWLDAHAIMGRFSENGFLQVEATRTVSFHSDQDTNVEELQAAITVTHLKHSRWA
uniref:beta-mannosidase n=1 Tax=Dendroctonus ponderosae TaxID=77166 RepID=J3JUU1_DENPD|nr:unknown [Dendroctonus ponderosae]